jgi:hypothetical protein
VVSIGAAIGASIGVTTGTEVTRGDNVVGGSIGVSIGASLSSITGRVVAIGTLVGTLCVVEAVGDIDGTNVGRSDGDGSEEVQNSVGGPVTDVYDFPENGTRRYSIEQM